MSIRIAVVDDTRMFRDGLSLVIDMQDDMTVVGAAGDGAAGLEVVRQNQPDVVLMDIRMPVMDGVEATRRIKEEFPHIHVVVLTTYSDDEYLFEALRAGAVGYMLKDLPATELVSAVRAVIQGGVLIPPALAARLVAEFTRVTGGDPGLPSLAEVVAVPAPTPAKRETVPDPSRLSDLTPREHEILRLVAEGLSNREVAERLYLSEGTVKNYVSSIFSKLHARDRAQAISMAMRQGLID